MGNAWWKNSVVYQIYPQSFKDSNGDGVGDLIGIKEKLPYLSKLGIDVIWLNPIYESPLVDNGYDISDYEKILSVYGSMEDFQELLVEAHSIGIRIILDLVVNHTSDQHSWFLESKKSKNNPYSDYYIWKDPKPDGSAPNNWGSTFGGPAWEYVAERNQYYLHCFAKEQPDLNWENSQVRHEIQQMMKRWFDLGIDGFRMDVITLISKRQEYPDAPDGVPYTKSYYVGASNGPRVHEFLQELNHEVLSRYDVMTVGEAPNTNSDQALQYTLPENKELNMVFHFDHMHLDYGRYGKFSDIHFKVSDLKAVLTEWQLKLEKGWNSLYWSNHDQPRAVTRFGDDGEFRVESAKMLATLLHMMKGTPYIFQGEELGMKNVHFDSIEDYKDIETKYFYQLMKEKGESPSYIEDAIYLKSRDNARTPFPWNGNKEEGYGFSSGEPWIQYSPDNLSIHAEACLADSQSIFYYYQKLISLRHEFPIIAHGKYELINEKDSDVFSYLRKYKGQILLVVCSFSQQPTTSQVPSEFVGHSVEHLIGNYTSNIQELPKFFELAPFEAQVFLLK
ncbi:alpha-glucosidase [Streptococcus parasanguinis]|jgi:oligo-1,6-glucosidase|uniref:glycoside hydrolase family 13 protein n=1 Tax=Streptococcus parasanguinis TaxID=1318 RepID=UPI00066AA319|nr:alpha-glucosidase [Streptococcus parasanguinis]MDK8143068.1 alpha-glucosidase [Streptococcus parasanguinis]